MYDAIVIGSGMSGGWAAKELTENGLKTLMIESGRNVEHINDYPTTNMYPWQFGHRVTVPYANYQGFYSLEWEKLWHPELAEPEIALAQYPGAIKKYF